MVVATVLAAAGCTAAPSEMPGQPDAAQIREYEGEGLSSVTDFRENSIAGPQYVVPAHYTLTAHGVVDEEKTYSYEEIISGFDSHQKVVTLFCVEGWDVTLLWEGVRVEDILEEAGIQPEARTIIFRSVDNYSTSLFLDFIRDNDILIAHKMNDVVLPPENGFPFQLVAESKWGYKWIKWIDEIEVSADTDDEGYWEQRGFSDVGDLDKSFFD